MAGEKTDKAGEKTDKHKQKIKITRCIQSVTFEPCFWLQIIIKIKYEEEKQIITLFRGENESLSLYIQRRK